jgi:MFS family permease
MTSAKLRAGLGLAGIFALPHAEDVHRLAGIRGVYRAVAGRGRPHVGRTRSGHLRPHSGRASNPTWMLVGRCGRKRTIYLGLLLFAAGSYTAAFAHDSDMVILGRFIQGADAISAAVIAPTGDPARDEQRTQVKAIPGVTSSVTFSALTVAGPVPDQAVGVPEIFALTGALALAAMAVMRSLVANPVCAGCTRSYPVPLHDRKRGAGLSRKLGKAPDAREIMLLTREGMCPSERRQRTLRRAERAGVDSGGDLKWHR